MSSFLQSIHFRSRFTVRYFLTASWVAGLLSGIALYFCSGDCMVSLMRGVSFMSVSIVLHYLAAFLPFLITAFAVFVFRPWILKCISFLKAACFSYVSLGILDSFGTHGWLIRFLLMFAEIFTIPVFFTLWIRAAGSTGRIGFAELFGWFSLLFLIVSIHCRVIIPFCAGLNIL